MGKPSNRWIFEGYKGSNMASRNLKAFFKEQAIRALGENRRTEFVFKDLRTATTRLYWTVT